MYDEQELGLKLGLMLLQKKSLKQPISFMMNKNRNISMNVKILKLGFMLLILI